MEDSDPKEFESYCFYHYPFAVIELGISPSDFWEMTPCELRWLRDFKFPPKKSNDISRLKKLFDLPEARPSKGRRNGNNT